MFSTNIIYTTMHALHLKIPYKAHRPAEIESAYTTDESSIRIRIRTCGGKIRNICIRILSAIIIPICIRIRTQQRRVWLMSGYVPYTPKWLHKIYKFFIYTCNYMHGTYHSEDSGVVQTPRCMALNPNKTKGLVVSRSRTMNLHNVDFLVCGFHSR